MPSLIRRPEPMPEPELIDREPVADFDEMPGEDRIRSKISAAVRNRKVATGEMAPEHDPSLPLTKGRGRGPDPLILNSGPIGDLPPEPPVTSAELPPEPVLSAQPAPEWQEPLHQDFAPEPDSEDAPMPEPIPPARPAMKIPVAEPRKPVVAQPVRRTRRPRAGRRPRRNLRCHSRISTRISNCRRWVFCPTRPAFNVITSAIEALEENARMLENVLDDYGVKGEIVSVAPARS